MGAACCTNDDISTIDANVPHQMSSAKLVAKACIAASKDDETSAAAQTDKDANIGLVETKTDATNAPVIEQPIKKVEKPKPHWIQLTSENKEACLNQ